MKSMIMTSHGKHKGSHPVTMRSHVSPRQNYKPQPAEAISMTPDINTSKKLQNESASINETSSPACPLPHSTPHKSLASQTPSKNELEAENLKLKTTIVQLNEELRGVLDHSIESDMRLLQYTDQVFVANTSRSDNASSMADFSVQCDLQSLSISCNDVRCKENLALVENLRTTIEVLEAELQCLKTESVTCKCMAEEPENTPWAVWTAKKQPPIRLENRFGKLNNEKLPKEEVGPSQEASSKTSKPKRKNKKVKSMQKSQESQKGNKATSGDERQLSKQELKFSQVTIESDSHGRHLAGLIQQLVTTKTRVTGYCKPGAKLQSVASCSPPPPGGCYVLIAGANDVAAGEQYSIYEHLEQRITTRLKTSKVVVSTLPHRHDLPADHPINIQTNHVNFYIEELCARLKGVELLHINNITRPFFTRHGLHLRRRGKQMLARLLLESILRLDTAHTAEISSIVPEREPVLPVTPCSPEPSSEPRTLPYETFADAVRSEPSTKCKGRTTSPPTSNKPIFLEM